MSIKRGYEMPIILTSKFNQEEAEEYLNKAIVGYMKARKIKVANIENNGKVTLAYPIKKEEEGFFYTLYFYASTSALTALINHFNLQKEILRYIIFKQEEISSHETKSFIQTKQPKEEVKPVSSKKPSRFKKTAKVPIKEIDKKLEDIFKETL